MKLNGNYASQGPDLNVQIFKRENKTIFHEQLHFTYFSISNVLDVTFL